MAYRTPATPQVAVVVCYRQDYWTLLQGWRGKVVYSLRYVDMRLTTHSSYAKVTPSISLLRSRRSKVFLPHPRSPSPRLVATRPSSPRSSTESSPRPRRSRNASSTRARLSSSQVAKPSPNSSKSAPTSSSPTHPCSSVCKPSSRPLCH